MAGRPRGKEFYRGGPWYVVNFEKLEFARAAHVNLGRYADVGIGELHVVMTPGIKHANSYDVPHHAQAVALRLNLERGGRQWQAVGRLAAECIDEMIRRDGLPKAEGDRRR